MTWPLGTVACFAMLALGMTPLHGPASTQPAKAAPASAAASPSTTTPIEGFRQARFGMSELEVRQAIRRDFPAAAGRLSKTTHPGEKTTVLALTVEGLLPDAGPAQLIYILGYTSKRLVQVNISWSSDGRSVARDEAVIAAANALRDHFQMQHPAPPDEVVTNQKLAENAFLVFRAAQADGRMVLLLLSGLAAARRADRALPLTLQLSYIRDYRGPDVFRIERGRF